MSTPVPPTPPAPRPKRSLASVLALPVLLILIGGGVYAYFYFTTKPTDPTDPNALFAGYVRDAARNSTLAPEFQDDGSNGKLVAGKPKDGKYFDPPELLFAEVAGDDPDKRAVEWAAFLKHLSAKTGKPARFLKQLAPPPEPPAPKPPANPDDREEQPVNPAEVGRIRTLQDQLDALKSGKLHVAAFSTGQVSAAVNTAGFVPLFGPADKDGKFGYEMVVIVPKGSPAKAVADLKGKTVGLVALSSNSGAKAPLVIFRDEFNLKPFDDYAVTLTGRHQSSIQEVATGKLDAACVASDLLKTAVASGLIEEGDVRVIYTSKQTYPALCFGVANNLDPALKAKVIEAFATFAPTGPDSLWETRYKGQGRVKFAPVNYQKDWEPVRTIEKKLAEQLKAK